MDEVIILKIVRDVEGYLRCVAEGTAWVPSEELVKSLEKELIKHSTKTEDMDEPAKELTEKVEEAYNIFKGTLRGALSH